MIKILEGNCFEKVKEIKDNSIDWVVSSPPYFGLRDYGVEGQYGLEPTYLDYIQKTVELFRLIKPKLKDTGTIWWNVGDSYSGGGKHVEQTIRKNISSKYSDANVVNAFEHKGKSPGGVIKAKDLMMIPNRVAIALQEDGWYIRSEIIWHKPNPMPESVKDRPTSSHEKIWLITKTSRYDYDHEAIKEDSIDPESYSGRKKRNQSSEEHFFSTGHHSTTQLAEGTTYEKRNKRNVWTVNEKEDWGKYGSKDVEKKHRQGFTKDRNLDHLVGQKSNKRNVWTVTTKSFKGAHFATFPPDLIEPCIKAGCPEDGLVLDPFGGSGTTGLVADRLGRNSILIELNPKYVKIMKKRLLDDSPLFMEMEQVEEKKE